LVWPVKFVMVAALVLYVLRILANLWIILRNVIAQDTRAAGDI
jgi:uncharacterized membrane protein YqhA